MHDGIGVSPKVEIQENSGFDYSDYLEDNTPDQNGMYSELHSRERLQCAFSLLSYSNGRIRGQR